MAQSGSGEPTGMTDWPIERIAQQVGPTDAQRTLLDQLKDATANAVNLLKSACPTDLPSTPTGRLAAMRQRIASMLPAGQIVHPALDKPSPQAAALLNENCAPDQQPLTPPGRVAAMETRLNAMLKALDTVQPA